MVETAILVRLILPADTEEEVEESLDEMRRLAWTAGAEVVCTVFQRRAKPCPGTLVGTGKMEVIAAVCAEHDADLVVFDTDLTPSQGVKLQDAFGVKVVDRTQLILDIFAQRARTNEGKYQVELAQLEYTLPRLAGSGAALMRQKGGTVKLCCIDANVREIFRIMRMDKLVDIFDTEEEAVRSFKGRLPG